MSSQEATPAGTVGRALSSLLAEAGIRRLFCVPGESYLALLDGLALDGRVDIVTTRHEAPAAFMAQAYARARGGVGVCLASRAPGALNLAIGLHAAWQDGTPLLALIGEVPAGRRGQRGAFQQLDVAATFGGFTKRAVSADRPEVALMEARRALYLAASERPGPVVVGLPEDVLEAPLSQPPGSPGMFPLPAAGHGPRPDGTQLVTALEWLQQAERPVVIAGGGVLRAGATPSLVRLAERWLLPVYSAWRRPDVFPNQHPCYAGPLAFANHPEVVAPLREADVTLAVGTQLNEVTTLHDRLPQGRLIHVHADPHDLAEVATRVPATQVLSIVSDADAFLSDLMARSDALAGPDPAGLLAPAQAAARRARLAEIHRRFSAVSTPSPRGEAGFVHPEGVIYHLRRRLPPEAAIVSDAGNFATWYQRFYAFSRPGTHFAPVSGSMGYGLPAAIGVALADRDAGRVRPVVLMAGDGGFLMTAGELVTAVALRLPIVALVFVNGLYGTVYAHQVRRYGGRVVATRLDNPDFAALARASGAAGERVDEQIAFEEAFDRAVRQALDDGIPQVLQLRVNPERLHALEEA